MRSHLMMVLLRLRFLSFVLPSSTTHSTLGVEANNRLGPEGIHRDGRAEASDDRESGGQPEAGFMYSCAYRFESKATSRSSAAFPKKPLGANLGDGEVLVSAEVSLDTESVMKALKIIYRTEGVAGWFRGVGPRGVWTSVQSGTMLVMYQTLLKWFEDNPVSKSLDS